MNMLRLAWKPWIGRGDWLDCVWGVRRAIEENLEVLQEDGREARNVNYFFIIFWLD